MSAVNFDSLFVLDKSVRTRGHSLKLKKRLIYTDLRQHKFFSERIVDIWDALEDKLVCSSSLVFKNGFHQLWKNDNSPMGLL